MHTTAIDLTRAREDLSRLVDDVYLNKNKAYIVYKRKIPLAMLVKFEDRVAVVANEVERKVDAGLFGIWKGKKNSNIMSNIKKKAWKNLEDKYVG